MTKGTRICWSLGNGPPAMTRPGMASLDLEYYASTIVWFGLYQRDPVRYFASASLKLLESLRILGTVDVIGSRLTRLMGLATSTMDQYLRGRGMA